MQTLIVTYKTVGGTGSYPALRGKRLSKKSIASTLDHLTNFCQWEIVRHRIDEDGMSRAEDNRQYRSLCRAERRRGA
jgi:hypothetical protein